MVHQGPVGTRRPLTEARELRPWLWLGIILAGAGLVSAQEAPPNAATAPAGDTTGFDDDPLMRVPAESLPPATSAPAAPATASPFDDDALLHAPADPRTATPESSAQTPVEAPSRLHLSGYVKQETAFRTSLPREFTKILQRCQVQLDWRATDALAFTAIGRADYDAVFDLAGGYSEAAEAHDEWDVDLREAYADLRTGALHVRAGRQQIVWGDTLGLKVLDVVNPQDFREFILDDFIDSRIPLWSLRAEGMLGALGPCSDVTLEGLWIPDLRFAEPAAAGSEFALPAPAAPPGVRVVTRSGGDPADTPANSEWGVRLRTVVDGWDVSLSYLDSWDDTPVVARRFDPFTLTLEAEPRHERAHIAGAALTNAFGGLVVSAEVAWWLSRAFTSDDLDDHDGLSHKDFVQCAVSADYELFDFDLGAQYFQSVVLNHDSALVSRGTESAASISARRQFWSDTLTASAFLLHDFGTGDEWLRLEAAYDINDHCTVKLGTDLLEGEEDGGIGAFDHRDRVYVELKYSF